MESDFIYFSRRAQEEREAAMRNAHPSARRAHLEMATRYDELAVAIDKHQRLLVGPAAGAA